MVYAFKKQRMNKALEAKTENLELHRITVLK